MILGAIGEGFMQIHRGTLEESRYFVNNIHVILRDLNPNNRANPIVNQVNSCKPKCFLLTLDK